MSRGSLGVISMKNFSRNPGKVDESSRKTSRMLSGGVLEKLMENVTARTMFIFEK